MKYIRTKDGRIIDLQKFIEKEKENPYYTDYEFEEIKNEEDCCSIHWTAIGTKENSLKDQIGRRCQFGATIDSPFIEQANTIEELCDEFVIVAEDNDKPFIYDLPQPINSPEFDNEEETVYGAIWAYDSNDAPTLKSVARMNENGELELL